MALVDETTGCIWSSRQGLSAKMSLSSSPVSCSKRRGCPAGVARYGCVVVLKTNQFLELVNESTRVLNFLKEHLVSSSRAVQHNIP
jgi:hypothetical protein